MRVWSYIKTNNLQVTFSSFTFDEQIGVLQSYYLFFGELNILYCSKKVEILNAEEMRENLIESVDIEVDFRGPKYVLW